jgi:XTP/dITP diphosphohydrolase
MDILLATQNRGKIREMKSILKETNIKLKTLDDFVIEEVEETGKTFEENASLKASQYAKQTGLWTLADDSGLEVEALNNSPGIFSARYAGINSTDEENIAKLLDALDKSKNLNRKARFVCVIAISDSSGEVKQLSEGICNGKIAINPLGSMGFGYDPVFIPNGYNESFGTLDNEIKRRISHRKIAINKIIHFLNNLA